MGDGVPKCGVPECGVPHGGVPWLGQARGLFQWLGYEQVRALFLHDELGTELVH